MLNCPETETAKKLHGEGYNKTEKWIAFACWIVRIQECFKKSRKKRMTISGQDIGLAEQLFEWMTRGARV